MDEDAFQRFEALQQRARQAVAAARETRDRGLSTERVKHLVTELDATAHELEGLRAAMRTRASIEQAKGILMCLHNYGDQEAFTELVRISQATQTKLHDVAARLISQVSQPAGASDMHALTESPGNPGVQRAS